jgi:predicted adenine nucleotide alpha hydrolase (AANH) superfamily ATPase
MKSEGHDLTGFWFNPNIHPYEEYKSRLDSVKKLSGLWDIDMSYVK